MANRPLIAFLLLLVGPSLVGAGEVCRKLPPDQPLEKGDVRVVAGEAVPASFIFDDDPRDGNTISLTGHVCKYPSGEPLVDIPLRIVRFEGSLPEGKAPKAEDFTSGVLQEVSARLVSTDSAGAVTVVGLLPGNYSVLPDWDALAAQGVQFVLYDLRQTYSFTLLSQYAQP